MDRLRYEGSGPQGLAARHPIEGFAMNQMEKAICQSVREAFETYDNMTGDWLFEAPEHYLQNAIFTHMSRRGFELLLEATKKKILRGEGTPRKGRPAKSDKTRYDLIVWHKSSRTMRAVIEVKRSFDFSSALVHDVRRIESEKHASAGYLVVYTESKTRHGIDRVRKKLSTWEERLGVQWLNTNTNDFLLEGNDDQYVAAFALFRRVE